MKDMMVNIVSLIVIVIISAIMILLAAEKLLPICFIGG